jgi:hypothetical protein
MPGDDNAYLKRMLAESGISADAFDLDALRQQVEVMNKNMNKVKSNPRLYDYQPIFAHYQRGDR